MDACPGGLEMEEQGGDGKGRQFEAEGSTFPAWTCLGCSEQGRAGAGVNSGWPDKLDMPVGSL